MQIAAPEGFIDTPEFHALHATPVAFVIPTTAAARNATGFGTAAERVATVGDPHLGPMHSPTSLLDSLRRLPSRPALVVFTDQIVDQANTSILVKTEQGDRFISPLELILSSNYGYTIVFWTPAGFIRCPAGTLQMDTFARLIVEHLDGANALGSAWEAAGLQHFRSMEARRFNARRKLRFFRSSVINTFKHTPASGEAKRLIDRADALEQTIDEWSSAA